MTFRRAWQLRLKITTDVVSIERQRGIFTSDCIPWDPLALQEKCFYFLIPRHWDFDLKYKSGPTTGSDAIKRHEISQANFVQTNRAQRHETDREFLLACLMAVSYFMCFSKGKKLTFRSLLNWSIMQIQEIAFYFQHHHAQKQSLTNNAPILYSSPANNESKKMKKKINYESFIEIASDSISVHC